MDDKKTQAVTIPEKLQIKVSDSEQVHFEGEADVLSSTDENGPFDLLPMHANFISIINDHLIIYKSKQVLKEVKLETGILKVADNRVSVFLGLQALEVMPAQPVSGKVVK